MTNDTKPAAIATAYEDGDKRKRFALTRDNDGTFSLFLMGESATISMTDDGWMVFGEGSMLLFVGGQQDPTASLIEKHINMEPGAFWILEQAIDFEFPK